MQTVRYALAALLLATTFSIANTAGLPAVYGMEDEAPTGSTLSEQMDQAAGSGPVAGDGISGQVDGTDDQSIISVALNSVGFLLSVATGVALMPITLQSMGLPSYAAIPLGTAMVIIISIGILEFATQRVFD